MSTLTPPLPAHKAGQTSISILAIAASVALLYFGRVFFITVVIAIIIAFLLDPIVTVFMRLRVPRAVASFIVCTVALLTMYLVALGLYTEFAGFVEDLPLYSQRMNEMVDVVAARADQFEKRSYQFVVPKRFQETPSPTAPADNGRKRRTTRTPAPPEVVAPPVIPEVRIHSDPTPLLSYVYGYFKSFYSVLLMASFVPFLVYFMLSWRDHMRRSFLYLFSGTERQMVGKSWD
jgi:predicted PurR-regulated permease PerM